MTKKDKFSGRHGETAERFKAEETIKTLMSRDAPVEKVQEMGVNVRPSRRVGKFQSC